MNAINKLKHITVSAGWKVVEGKTYRVEATINSIDYDPGAWLSHDEIVKLCNSDWVVQVVRSAGTAGTYN